MYFDTFADFLAMGRHGLYVWLSYGIFLAIILWNIWLVATSRKEALKLTRQAWRRADAKTDRADAAIDRADAKSDRADAKTDTTDVEKNEEVVSP